MTTAVIHLSDGSVLTMNGDMDEIEQLGNSLGLDTCRSTKVINQGRPVWIQHSHVMYVEVKG